MAGSRSPHGQDRRAAAAVVSAGAGLLVLLAIGWPHGAVAQSDLRIVAQIGGPTRAVAQEGDVAYVGRGPRVLAYAACDPNAPVLIGQSDLLGGAVLDLLPAGAVLYAALGSAGIAVLDVSAPSEPALVFELPLAGAASHLILEGDRLYVVAGYGGLRILSVADPRAPREIGYFQAIVSDAVVLGTFAYVVKRDFTVVDMSDPAAPRQLKKLADWADSVTLEGQILIVAESESAAGGARDGWLQLFDLKDPKAPRARGRLSMGPPARLLRYLAGRVVAFQPDAARLVDVSDPDRPADAGGFPAYGTVSNAAGGSRGLFLAAGPYGLQAMRPEAGGYIESWHEQPLADAQAVAVADGVAYVEDEGGGDVVRAFDLSRPDRPHQIAILPMGVARESLLAGDGRLIVGDPDQVVHVLDVRSPGQPREVGRLALPEAIWALAGSVSRVVVANDETVRVLDVAEDGIPRLVGAEPALGGATDVAVAGNVAYVAGPATGLETGRPSLMAFEISSVGRPRQRAAMPDAAAWHQGLAASPGVAYLDGLQVVQGGLDGLAQVARLQVDGETRALVLSGNRLFAAMRMPEGAGRLLSYDVAQPSAPRQDAALELVDEALDTDVWRGYVFVAAKEAGLFVVRTDASSPPPTATRPSGLANSVYLPVAALGPVGVPCPGVPR